MNIVSVQNFHYQHLNREILFAGIGMQINRGQKIALVGKNGCGKTTLLESIVNSDQHKSISVSVEPYYLPQHLECYGNYTIAQALAIESKLTALAKIEQGSVDSIYYDTLGDDWDIIEQATKALEYWSLYDLNLNDLLRNLSGGERVKVFLAGIILHKPEFVILDEPTNHLDYEARELLYRWIQETKATLLLVSHDRTLLNLLTDIYDLTKTEVVIFTGTYEEFITYQDEQREALLNQLASQRQELRKAENIQRKVVERRQRQDARGASHTASKSLPRIVANMRKNFAQRTTGNLKTRHDDKIDKINLEINQLETQAKEAEQLKINIDNSDLREGKLLIKAKKVNYAYANEVLWKVPLSFLITSGDRVLIKGLNGCGKTTLIKLITQRLQPVEGELWLADFKYLYLDQNYSLIDDTKTVYEQAQSYNINMPEHEVKMHLARSQFESETWGKECNLLSGGEKMKLSLCSLIVSKQLPDVLILDEPTNNLDVESQNILLRTVQNFDGTLLVVSHDNYFINNLGITQEMELIKKKK